MNKKFFIAVLTAIIISISILPVHSVKSEMVNLPSEEQKTQTINESNKKNDDASEKADKARLEASPTDYGSQYFTQVSFTDLAGNSLAKVNDSDKIKVNYNFLIPGNVHENDTMKIQLPEQLQMVNYTDFPIMDTSGAVIANASIDKTTGLITLTFTNDVENKTDITGSLFFWAKFDKDKVVDGENIFPMPLQGVTTDLVLTVHKTVSTRTGTTNPTVIFKSGAFDKNDPSLINWTVTVNNANQNLIQPKVIDTMGAGQTLVPGTFSFNYRDESKKSLTKFTLPAGDDVTSGQTKVTITPTGFEAMLEDLGSNSSINHYSSVVITYQTKVDASTVRYINNVATTDELGQPQQRNASVIDYGSGGSASGSTQEAIDTLNNTIDTATSLDPEILPPEDATKLSDATTTAQDVVDNETATKEQLDQASTQLGQVVEDVTPSDTVPPVDDEVVQALEDLEQLVEEAKAKDPTIYTEKSWRVVEEALTDSETLLTHEKDNPGSTALETVKKSTATLTQALEALVTKEHEQLQNALTNLQHLVNVVESKNKALYTNETWNKLITAKEEAKKVLTAGINTVMLKEVLSKHDQLQKALDGLKEIATPPSTTKIQDNPPNHPDNSSKSNLPKTGEKSNSFLIIMGLLLLVTGFTLTRKRRTYCP